jgi:hypothetical protein
MLESLQQVASIFPRRFLFNALLPTFVFVTLTAAVLVDCFWSFTAESHWWESLDPLSKIGVTIGYVGMTWFLSAAVASQWRNIVRLYEGYPLQAAFTTTKWSAPGIRWHQKHLNELLGAVEKAGSDMSGKQLAKLNEKAARVYYRYPIAETDDQETGNQETGNQETGNQETGNQETLLPTTLGNILLSGESYSSERYDIDCIIFWPRLWHLLPEQFQRDYDECQTNFEFPLVASFLAAISALISGAVLILARRSPWLFLAVFLGGFIFAYGAYYFSFSGAVELAEKQKTAFDLYRDRLLEAWPQVPDIKDEKEAFKSIRSFVFNNAPASWEKSQSDHHARRTRAEQTSS